MHAVFYHEWTLGKGEDNGTEKNPIMFSLSVRFPC